MKHIFDLQKLPILSVFKGVAGDESISNENKMILFLFFNVYLQKLELLRR